MVLANPMCEAKAADPAASSCNTPVDVWGNHQCNCTIDLSLFCTATKKHPIYDKHTPSTSEPERPCTLHCLAIPCLSLDLQDHKQPGLDHGWQLAHIPRSRRGPAHCTAWPCLSPDSQDHKQPNLDDGWRSSHKRICLRVERPCTLHCLAIPCLSPDSQDHKQPGMEHGWQPAQNCNLQSRRGPAHCTAWPCLSPDSQDQKQPGLDHGWRSSHKRTCLRVEEVLHIALPGHTMPFTRFTRSQATRFGTWLAANSKLHTSESERPCTLHCLAMPLTRVISCDLVKPQHATCRKSVGRKGTI